MSAPSTEADPKSEQPTLPLPISRTLPRGGTSWLLSPDSEILFVVVPLAAIATGLLINTFGSLTYEDGSNFAIVALLGVLLGVVGGGFLFARRLSRGKDGRS